MEEISSLRVAGETSVLGSRSLSKARLSEIAAFARYRRIPGTLRESSRQPSLESRLASFTKVYTGMDIVLVVL